MSHLHLRHAQIRIQAGNVWLDAFLSCAPDVRALVLWASPNMGPLRNSRFARANTCLHQEHYGTLMLNLITPHESERVPDVVYDVSLLGERLQSILIWIENQPELSDLPLGLLACGTASGAAIRLLARETTNICAIVSRSGREDLAGIAPLSKLHTPILCQVPGEAAEFNQPRLQAYAKLSGIKGWQEYPQADENFTDDAALHTASLSARDWFTTQLPPRPEVALT